MNRIEWEAEVKKALHLKGKTIKDMSNETGRPYGSLRKIVTTGVHTSQKAVDEVSEYLGIESYSAKEFRELMRED